MEPSDSLSCSQGLGLGHCPEQSESSAQPTRLSALKYSNWFLPRRLSSEKSVIISYVSQAFIYNPPIPSSSV
jgi:hypothetical protein